MMLYYKTKFIPMVNKEDKDNGYDCVGIVVGEHRWYDADPYNEHPIHDIKYHQYSVLMIGVMPL